MGLTIGIPLLALAAVFQASLIPLLYPIGGRPNLVFLLVLAWAIYADLRGAILWAVAGGLVLDLLSAMPLGTSAIGLTLIVTLVAGLGSRVVRVGPLWLIGLTLGGSAGFEIYRIVTADLFQGLGLLPSDTGFAVSWLEDLTDVVLPTMLYNLVLIWFVYAIMRRIQRRVTASQ